MDEVYNDLLQYESSSNRKNALEDSRRFIESVLASMSDILIVCNRRWHDQEVNSIRYGASSARTRPSCAGNHSAICSLTPLRNSAPRFFDGTRGHRTGTAGLLIRGRDGSLRISLNFTPRLSGTSELVGMVYRPPGWRTAARLSRLPAGAWEPQDYPAAASAGREDGLARSAVAVAIIRMN
ncbi:MAG: hypothetical protein IPK02_20415 [Candidatus Accumulibacter sp.]|uniref:Uncharacterized protein n=1 Tax=Candidatus Accumulibacter affinis TaxID=2954384 RepID=A0A935TDL2_9PROT|nr:hypothetical protein [Candidatus Accumulibacter affinis]